MMLGALLVGALVVQTALLPHAELAGFRPDLPLLFTAVVALRHGPDAGVRVGFGAGLLTDLLLTQTAIGTTALVLTALGFAVGSVRPFVAPDSFASAPIVGFVATLLGTLGFGLLAVIFGDQSVTAPLLFQAAVLTGVYNLLAAPVVGWLVDRVEDVAPIEARAAPLSRQA